MKNSTKRTLDELYALGFQSEPHPYKRGTTLHWHANSPDEKLRVFAGMSAAAAVTLIQRARAIVGLATTETGASRRDAKARSSSRRAQEEAQKARHERAVAEREAEKIKRDAVLWAAKMRRQTGGYGKAPFDTACEFWTLQRCSDETGWSLQRISRLISSGSLAAYMTKAGESVRVEDVRQLVAAIRRGGAA